MSQGSSGSLLDSHLKKLESKQLWMALFDHLYDKVVADQDSNANATPPSPSQLVGGLLVNAINLQLSELHNKLSRIQLCHPNLSTFIERDFFLERQRKRNLRQSQSTMGETDKEDTCEKPKRSKLKPEESHAQKMFSSSSGSDTDFSEENHGSDK